MTLNSVKIKRYSTLISDFVVKRVTNFSEGEKKELIKIYEAVLTNSDGPRSLNRKKGREDELATKLFRKYFEILSSYESLNNIIIYINSFPYKKKISKYAYLRYHVENYLHELYILEQRLRAYLTDIHKIYKKSEIKKEVDSTCRKLDAMIIEAFKRYLKIRGSHVHDFRFSNNDLDTLSLYDNLCSSKNNASIAGMDLKVLYSLTYKDVKSKWKRRIRDDIKNIDKLLEIYFDSLHKTITKKGILIFPWKK